MEEEAEVNTTKTPRRSPRLLDQLPASQLPPIAEEEEDVDIDTTEAPKRIPRSLRNLATYNKPGLREGLVNPEGRR